MIITTKILVPITSPPLVDAALVIDEGRIVSIEQKEVIVKRYPGEEIRDYPHGVILPGLINLHTHLEYTALGGIQEPTPFLNWLDTLITKSLQLRRGDWEASYRTGIQELKRCGVTTVVDIARWGVGLDDLIASGLRGTYCMEFLAVDDTRLSSAGEELNSTLNSALPKVEGTKIQIGLAPHSLYTLSKNALSFVGRLASERDMFITIHLAESKEELSLIRNGEGPLRYFLSRYHLDTIPPQDVGISPTAYLLECGIMRNRLLISHAVWVDDKDLRLLREKRAGIALCVRSNHLLKNGKAPVEKMKELGIQFGIGTDSLASNSSLDLFEEMRFLKNRYHKFSNEELLRMVTINSAEILGMSGMIGSIEEGKRADLIVMGLKKAVSPSQLYQYLIEEGGKDNLLLSLVDGKVIFERGEA